MAMGTRAVNAAEVSGVVVAVVVVVVVVELEVVLVVLVWYTGSIRHRMLCAVSRSEATLLLVTFQHLRRRE